MCSYWQLKKERFWIWERARGTQKGWRKGRGKWRHYNVETLQERTHKKNPHRVQHLPLQQSLSTISMAHGHLHNCEAVTAVFLSVSSTSALSQAMAEASQQLSNRRYTNHSNPPLPLIPWPLPVLSSAHPTPICFILILNWKFHLWPIWQMYVLTQIQWYCKVNGLSMAAPQTANVKP